MIDRVHRELTEEDIDKIVSTYHNWKQDVERHDAECSKRGLLLDPRPAYQDVAGFCKSAMTAEIMAHGNVLTPGRYVGAGEVEDDGDPFAEKMPRLVSELRAQFADSAKLEEAIDAKLRGLGYGE